jgi:hypothetical protein
MHAPPFLLLTMTRDLVPSSAESFPRPMNRNSKAQLLLAVFAAVCAVSLVVWMLISSLKVAKDPQGSRSNRTIAALPEPPVHAGPRPKPAASANKKDPLADFAATARIRAIRRHYLRFGYVCWKPGKAEKVEQAGTRYEAIRRRWQAWMIGGRRDKAELPGQLLAARAEVDDLFSDLTEMNDVRGQEYQRWEKNNWQSYPAPRATFMEGELAEYLEYVRDPLDPNPVSDAFLDFVSTRNSVLFPLLEQLEELLTSVESVPIPETPEQTGLRRRKDELASQLQAQLDDYMSEWRRALSEWEAKNWQGYDQSRAANKEASR